MSKWARLIKTEPRGSILYQVLKPYLQPKDQVLDINCGYAPLAKSILDNDYNITGIDIAEAAISFLNTTYPQGTWVRSAINNFYGQEENLPEFNILTELGVDMAWDHRYQKFLQKLIAIKTPRLILFEVALGPVRPPKEGSVHIDPHQNLWIAGFNLNVQTALKSGYKILTYNTYDAQLDSSPSWSPLRFYVLLGDIDK